MKKLTFEGYVDENGTLRFNYPKIVRDFLHSLAGVEVDVAIGKHYRQRSDRQNRYYWGVVVPIVAREIGEENDEVVHSWLQIATKHTKDVNGTLVPRGTKDLTTVEFEEYAANARMFASKFLSVYIPLPNEGISRVG